MSIGAQIYYAESIEALGRNMTEARPTIMTAVPRLYETLHARILHGLRKVPALRRGLFDRALALGRRRYDAPESRSPLDRVADAAPDRLVRRQGSQRFGAPSTTMVSGTAPPTARVGTFSTPPPPPLPQAPRH